MNRLQLAKKAVKAAGKIVKKGFNAPQKQTQTKRDANDLVTEFDVASQQKIVSFIQKYFPEDNIVGEEEGFNEIDHKTGWVIDPIDGTNPFSRKINAFGIVLGYMINYEAQFCVVFNPIDNELFVGEKGNGATLNGKPLTLTKRPFENQLISLEGFRRKNASYMRYLFQDYVYNVTGRSSSSYSTLMVLKGQSDAFITDTAKIWDRIHYIILQEAGFTLTNFAGKKYTVDQTDYIAAHPMYHKKYLKILSENLKKLNKEKEKKAN